MGQKNEKISKQENKNNNLVLNTNIDSENEEYILEGKCGDSVKIEKNIEKKLFEKAQNATCQINSMGGRIGTGFFFKYKIKEEDKYFLITNNHILDSNSINKNNYISIIYKNKK